VRKYKLNPEKTPEFLAISFQQLKFLGVLTVKCKMPLRKQG
jgi:hypothetical protein